MAGNTADEAVIGEMLRRAEPRQATDWFGFYRFGSTDSEAWRLCRVLDMSPHGARIELLDLTKEDRTEDAITVKLELRGTPRNVTTGAEGNSATIGMEFSGTDE